MAFNFFQKKKDSRPDSARGSKEKISEKSSAVFGSKKTDTPVFKKESSEEHGKKTNIAPKDMVLHISEKSSNLSAKNFYVFKAPKNSNKIILKKIVEDHYGVKVESVRILNTKHKKRTRGNIVGKKPGYKKAVIKLKEGYKIEF